IEFTAVPFLDGVRELADLDFFPSGSRRNHAAYRDAVDWNGLPEVEQLMLCDAQTSGGLLVAIPSRRAETFARELPSARRIGVMRGDGKIRVRVRCPGCVWRGERHAAASSRRPKTSGRHRGWSSRRSSTWSGRGSMPPPCST